MVFTLLAVFISCLGLFGLASYVAEQRTKEIGIRKILGASAFYLWKMLSLDFITMVFISCFIAVPLTYYFMNNWIMSYEYKVEISGWIFIVSCLAAMVLTLITVSFQTLKSAFINPVDSLRSE
jgi:ABC-type antimicrobial peptide transport system permease subunit